MSDIQGFMGHFVARGFVNVRGRLIEGACRASANRRLAPSGASSSATTQPSRLPAAATITTRPVSPGSIPAPQSNL
jgi:hypothetical protein